MLKFAHTPQGSWIYNPGRRSHLAAYVHQFRTEAKQCNFTNNTATIKIFIKGLKNAYSLAARIYEKDPHTSTDMPSQR